MVIMLGIMAGLIFLLYSVYFIHIIKGDAEHLERQMLKSLADWIIRKKAATRAYIWAMFAGSVLVEAVYFYLTLVWIQNPVMLSLTGLFILFEIYHLLGLGFNLAGFFRGQRLLSQIFNWGLERSSAILFFTHAFLVLAILSAFA